MLLELKVFGSREWYEKVVPLLENEGFEARADLHWADPETDGELMGCYYDYNLGQVMPIDRFMHLMAQIQRIIEDGEAPGIEIGLVPSKDRSVPSNEASRK